MCVWFLIGSDTFGVRALVALYISYYVCGSVSNAFVFASETEAATNKKEMDNGTLKILLCWRWCFHVFLNRSNSSLYLV